MKNDIHDLGLVIDAGTPIIVIESYDELRVLEMMTRLAMNRGLVLFTWSVTEGLNRLGFGHGSDNEAITEADEVLVHIKKETVPSLFVLCDFHPYLQPNEYRNIRLLKDIALQHTQLRHTVVLLSHALDLPPEFKRLGAHFELSLPTDEQLLAMVREEANNWSKKNLGRRVKTDSKTLDKLVSNLRGLSLNEARQLTRGAIFDDGAITVDDLPEVNKAKFSLMDMEGVLSFEYETAHFSEVGGLTAFKAWLSQRRTAFLQPVEQQDIPKGVMLLGVQGGGKSLAAKAVAGMWGIPLLKMDFGALYNKYIGETERNIREALKLADVMSPCVLWMDEIEKGISVGRSDDGTSKRILGTLLTWMAERKKSVFVVATSNDITQLPPELIRKGRLDEIFFVDLPDAEVRRDIFGIHFNKRSIESESFDFDALVELTDGFSGAEIEQVIVGALYSAKASDESLQQTHLEINIQSTSPLSVVMAEDIAMLRGWAKNRAVQA